MAIFKYLCSFIRTYRLPHSDSLQDSSNLWTDLHSLILFQGG